MYSSTFIFAKKQYDDEFYRLDQAIAEAAKEIPGYLGEEAWENPTTGLLSNVYYWETLEALQSLVQHPRHLEAKAAQSNWLDGYQVVISLFFFSFGVSFLSCFPASFAGFLSGLRPPLDRPQSGGPLPKKWKLCENPFPRKKNMRNPLILNFSRIAGPVMWVFLHSLVSHK